MTAVAIPSEKDALRRYAGFLARFTATPMAAVWILGREPELFTYNRGARQRIQERVSTLKALCATITGNRRLVSIENTRDTTHVDLVEMLSNLGSALLAHPVVLGGKPIGCVLVLDDVSRGWFSDDVSAVMEIAESVSAHVGLRMGLERAEAAFAELEKEYVALSQRVLHPSDKA